MYVSFVQKTTKKADQGNHTREEERKKKKKETCHNNKEEQVFFCGWSLRYLLMYTIENKLRL